VGELRVKEGDMVEAGELLAVLDSEDQLEAVWRSSEARIKVARSRLAQVRAGVKAADLEAQRAEIARIESELAAANVDLRRVEQLRERNVSSVAALEQSLLHVETRTQLLNQAKARLNSMAEVRQVDMDLAAAEVEAAVADAMSAREDLAQTRIVSPAKGRVVEIHAWPREEVGPEGILELAKTDRMYVIAEVPESNIGRIRIDQRAVVTGDALAEPIHGTVERITPRIAKTSILDADPAAFSDTRVVNVKIRLDDSKIAAGFINARVVVVIGP
jgi:HlyD family secretion protein